MNTRRIAKLLALLLSLTFIGTGCALDTVSEQESFATSSKRVPGRFVIFKGNDGQYYFNLKAGNGHIVLQSEGYTSKAGAENGVASVKTNGVDLDHYELLEASNGQWYFNLEARNYQVIGTSELYVSKYNATRGMKTVREVIAKVLRYEAALEGGAGFDLFEGQDGQYYFHLEAANHEIVLQSEGYVSEAGALNGISSVRENGKDLANYEILEAADGQYYFNIKAQNHEIIGTSELYVSKYNAERGAETVADLLYSERVADPQ